jgi:hypothetical protein
VVRVGELTLAQIDEVVREIAESLRSSGSVPAVIPFGGSSVLGAQGYVDAGRELLEQAPDLDTAVVAVGSGGTMAGLVHALGADRVSASTVAQYPMLLGPLRGCSKGCRRAGACQSYGCDSTRSVTDIRSCQHMSRMRSCWLREPRGSFSIPSTRVGLWLLSWQLSATTTSDLAVVPCYFTRAECRVSSDIGN